jgi:hypothetical protein
VNRKKGVFMIVKNNNRGQSFVELALIFPLLLMIIAGFVEVGFFAYTYLTAIELTREAARFASQRDPFILDAPGSGLPNAACNDDDFHYYLDTVCVLLNTGANPTIDLDTNIDDITISVFTISGNVVTNRWPADGDGVWSLSTISDLWPGTESWTKDCEGNVVSIQPNITNADVQASFQTGAPTSRGLVLVELHYCYQQILNLPVLSDIIPNPIRIRAYTIMPANQALPTPTPIPAP